MNITNMRIGLFLAAGIFCASGGTYAENASDDLGERKFKALCVMCHPDGSNIINPKKTLHKADREANNIKTASDIIKLMRNPGPRMTIFNEKVVPEKKAQAIAEYVIRTFN